ncbi:hypothetical protein FB451DRAFT_1465483 [Mycena latifolia]|nr:hypothetical protein FB451DRAFT_1465483 [Mycena latifolia]
MATCGRESECKTGNEKRVGASVVVKAGARALVYSNGTKIWSRLGIREREANEENFGRRGEHEDEYEARSGDEQTEEMSRQRRRVSRDESAGRTRDESDVYTEEAGSTRRAADKEEGNARVLAKSNGRRGPIRIERKRRGSSVGGTAEKARGEEERTREEDTHVGRAGKHSLNNARYLRSPSEFCTTPASALAEARSRGRRRGCTGWGWALRSAGRCRARSVFARRERKGRASGMAWKTACERTRSYVWHKTRRGNACTLVLNARGPRLCGSRSGRARITPSPGPRARLGGAAAEATAAHAVAALSELYTRRWKVHWWPPVDTVGHWLISRANVERWVPRSGKIEYWFPMISIGLERPSYSIQQSTHLYSTGFQ